MEKNKLKINLYIKNKILILIICLLFLVIPLNVSAADTKFSTTKWAFYDHTDNDSLAVDDYANKKFISKNGGMKLFTSDYHINTIDNGKILKFLGYPSEPYADMIFYNGTNKDTKLFKFSIKKQQQTDLHTFTGFGLWINSKITGDYPSQSISGYLLWVGLNGTSVFEIKETEAIDISDLRSGNAYARGVYGKFSLTADSNGDIIPGYLANRPAHGIIRESVLGSSSVDKDMYIKLEVNENWLKLWRSSSPIEDGKDDYIVNWEPDQNKERMTTLWIQNNTSSYGFGAMVQYSPHGCSKQSIITITDLAFPVPLINPTTPNDGSNPDEVTNPNTSENPGNTKNTCADKTYNNNNYCQCKALVCDDNFPKDCIGKFIFDIYQIIKISVTVILLVLSIIDFMKAMTSADNEKMKKNINNFKTRIIIVVIILFGPVIIDFLLGLFSGDKWSTCGIR